MRIYYNVSPPSAGPSSKKCEETLAIEEFLTSGNARNMCFEYDSLKLAKSKMTTVRSHCIRMNQTYCAYRRGKCIYILRKTRKDENP